MSEAMLDIPLNTTNPVEPFLRMDRMPHIWCPGCGIGTTVNCFTRALESSKLDLNKVAIVSGIGCTGRVAGYAKLDSFHTTHGRAIPFATGLKLSNARAKQFTVVPMPQAGHHMCGMRSMRRKGSTGLVAVIADRKSVV